MPIHADFVSAAILIQTEFVMVYDEGALVDLCMCKITNVCRGYNLCHHICQTIDFYILTLMTRKIRQTMDLALQNLKWCVVAVRLRHVHDGQARCPVENKVTSCLRHK